MSVIKAMCRFSRVRILTAAVALTATLALVPVAAEAALVASSSGTSTVTLSWTAPGDDGDQGVATQYDIRYSTQYITQSNWSQAMQATGIPDPKPAGQSESFSVEGLEPNTTYYFALRVADEVPNWSPLSNVGSAVTDPMPGQDSTAPADVGNLQAINPTSTSVTLIWTAPGDDGSSGQASVYDIRYMSSALTWETATRATGEPSPSPSGSAEAFTITGLTPNTTYVFALCTGDEVPNWSNMSNVAVAFTSLELDETNPGQISDLIAGPGDYLGDLRLNWTSSGDDGTVGTASGYVVLASPDPITEANWTTVWQSGEPPTPLPSGSPQEHVISGLVPGQMYYVAVKAVDEAGNISPLSNVPTGVAQWSFALDNDDEPGERPDVFHLAQNYPNPFNPATTIEFSVPSAEHVSLSIYNIQGQLIDVLVDERKSAGVYTAEWDVSTRGRRIASGVYFYRLSAGTHTETQKMILLK